MESRFIGSPAVFRSAGSRGCCATTATQASRRQYKCFAGGRHARYDNQQGARLNPLSELPAEIFEDTPAGPPFWDVNGDNFVSPIDAVLVINSLNSRTANGSNAE